MQAENMRRFCLIYNTKEVVKLPSMAIKPKPVD